MPVIAMTQEMGSLAKEIALQLAQECNLAVMRHEVLENVAGKMHVPTSLISRLREGKAGLVERFTTDSARVAVYTAEEVFALAAKGNVVLRGWGATCLLRPVPHVITVRVTRSMNKRVTWLMEQLGTSDAGFAEAEIRRSDNAHAAKIHAQFGVTWGDPLIYDLVINTERISVESAAAQIRHLTERPEFQETQASRAMLADLALAAEVRAALKDNLSTSEVNVDIQARSGQVVLRGIVVNETERDETVRVATRAAGVAHVENQLHVMAMRRFTYSKT